VLPSFLYKLSPPLELHDQNWPTMRKVLFWMTCVSVGVLFASITCVSERAIGNIATIAIAMLICCLSSLYLFLYGKIRLDLFPALLFGFNLWTLICSLANNFPSFRSSALTVGALSFFLYAFFSQGTKERNNALTFITFGSWVFLFVFVIYYRKGVFHPNFDNRIGSFFGNENDTARFLAFSLLFNIYGFFRPNKRCVLCLLASLLSFYLILLTGSISNLLTILLVCICALIVIANKKWRRIILCLLPVGFLAVFLILQLPQMDYFRSRLIGMITALFGGDSGIDYSARNRSLLALDSFRLMLQKPIFGFGFNAGIRNNTMHGFAHNNIAELGACFGVPGVLIFNFLVLFPLVALFKKKQNGEARVLGLLICGYIFVFQIFLVSYYTKLEYLGLALVYSATPQKTWLEKNLAYAPGGKRKKSISWNRVIPVLFSGISAVLGIATSFLIARPLGSELYSVVQYRLGLVGTLSIFFQLGINFVLTKNSQFEKEPGEYLTKYMLLFHIGSILITGLFFIIGYFFLQPLNKDVLVILLIALAAYIAAHDAIVSGFMLGTHRATLSSLVGSLLPKAILLVSAAVVMLVAGFEATAEWYVPLYGLGFLASSLPFTIVLAKPTKAIHFSKAEVALVFSFFLLSLSQSLNSYLSRVMQGQYDFYNTAEVSYTGVLGLALQIMTVATMFGSVVSNISAPDFAFLSLRASKADLLQRYRQTVRVNAYICVPFVMALASQAKMVLSLFGESYTGDASVIFFVLVAVATMVSNFTGPTGTLLTFSGHDKIQIINGLLYSSLFVVIALALRDVTVFGIPIAYLCATICVEAAKYIELAIACRANPIDWRTALLLVALAAVSFAVFFPIRKVTAFGDWVIVNLFLGVGLIVGAFLLTPFKKDRRFFLDGKKTS